MDALSILLPIGISLVVVVITLASVLMFVVPFFKRHAQAAKILQSGVSAQAQILGAQETGTRLNDQPEIAFSLLVQLPGRAPYQAQATSVMSHMLLARVQPGMTVPVKVDPANPQSVALDKAAMSSVPMAMGGMMPGMMPQQPMMPGMMPQQPMMPGMMPQQPMMPGMMQQPMMPGMMPGGMSQQQAMAMAQQAMAQPPAGGAIINCPACGGPYAIANPACPHCRAPRPQV